MWICRSPLYCRCYRLSEGLLRRVCTQGIDHQQIPVTLSDCELLSSLHFAFSLWLLVLRRVMLSRTLQCYPATLLPSNEVPFPA